MPTKIEWAEESWNPVTGCTKISEGCRNCYAEKMARRLAGRFGYPEKPHEFDVTLHPDKLLSGGWPSWKNPRRVFVCSMGDLFHDDVPKEYIGKVWADMEMLPQHTFLVLTKRPENMREAVWHLEPHCGVLENVWLGVSAENQETADERIPILLQTPAVVRFVSCEPLLGSVDLSQWLGLMRSYTLPHYPYVVNCAQHSHLNWVIVGGESGPGARPMHPDWVRSIRDQCQNAGVPFYFKQHGAWLHLSQIRCPMAELPITAEHLWQFIGTGDVSFQVGKKAAGRVLDGELWEEYPK